MADTPDLAPSPDTPAEPVAGSDTTTHDPTPRGPAGQGPVVGMAVAGGPAIAGRSVAPTPSRRWVNRADGDRRARARLQLIGDEGVIVLNDRRIPGSRSCIKCIAISTAGVFVIDTKAYRGLVHVKRQGPIRDLGPQELHVGRRNCTSSVDDLAGQVQIVREALSSTPWGSEVPVSAVLCLTRAEWGFASPLEIRDVWVGWPRLMAGRVREPGVMDSPTVHEVSQMITSQLA
jgi:Nuclease-related domain